MRIAYVRGTFPKSSETFILEEIAYLIDAGHQVRIFANWFDFQNLCDKAASEKVLGCVIYPDLVDDLSISKKIVSTCKLLWELRKQSYRTRFGKDYFGTGSSKKNLAENNVVYALANRVLVILRKSVYFFEVSPYALRLKNFSLGLQQYRLRRTAFEPEHIHAPFLFKWDVLKMQRLVADFRDATYSVTLRSRDIYDRTADASYVSARNKLIAGADHVFTISTSNRRYISENFTVRRDIEVVHSSINVAYFTRPQGQLPVPNRIVCVARLVQKKGHRTLLEACKILREKGQTFELFVVGGGPLMQEIQSAVNSLNLKGFVKLCGALPQKAVKAVLSSSAVCVLPCLIASDGDRDVLPNSLKEAMSMGVMVVTSRLPGIEELVIDGQTGILCTPEDAADLADKLLYALQRPEQRARICERARKIVEEQFNIQGEGQKFSNSLLRVHEHARSMENRREDLIFAS